MYLADNHIQHLNGHKESKSTLELLREKQDFVSLCVVFLLWIALVTFMIYRCYKKVTSSRRYSISLERQTIQEQLQGNFEILCVCWYENGVI